MQASLSMALATMMLSQSHLFTKLAAGVVTCAKDATFGAQVSLAISQEASMDAFSVTDTALTRH